MTSKSFSDQELFRSRRECRLCGDDRFDQVLDLGQLSLTGRFPAEEDLSVPTAPLRVWKCRGCQLVQLAHDFNRDALFRSSYGYRSGVNQTMRDHLRGIAEQAMELANLNAGDLVLDIGSNDATLLHAYPQDRIGIDRVGMDPTVAQYRSYYAEDMQPIADFFSADAFLEATEGRPAKAITSIAMLYDIPNLHEFVSDIRRSLKEDGVWIFEQSYLPDMLATCSFDTICHEHLLYFSLSTLSRLLDENGLKIFHAERNGCNGGSSRVFACHASDSRRPTDAYRDLLKAEAAMALDTESPYLAFKNQVEGIRDQINDFLIRARTAGKRIYGYGASTKGNTTLQYCGIGPEIMSAIADRNPKKWGLFTPGTRIPIISEKTARGSEPDVFFVLPWHFKPEFLKREEAFLQRGGQLVFPLPEFEVHGAKAVPGSDISAAVGA